MKTPATKEVSEIIKEGWKVDKIKLEVKYRNIEEVQNVLYHLEFDMDLIDSYNTGDLKKCSKNFRVNIGEGILYIGVGKNSYQGNWKENQKSMILEYNPQKVNPFTKDYLKHIQKMDKHRINIMSIDMAYDLYANIKELEIHQRHGNEKYGEFGKGGQVETKYLGAMGNNHVKIYNKVAELNKELRDESVTGDGEIIQNRVKVTGECTRIEITAKIKERHRGAFISTLNPFAIKDMIELPVITPKADKEQVLTRILNIGGKDTINLFAIHNGLENEFKEKRTRKKYIEMYEDIKKESMEYQSKDTNKKLLNYNHDRLYDSLKEYISQTFKGQEKIKMTTDL